MPTDTEMPLTAGAPFARFRIDEPLGKGGMAIVYKAYELHLERHVALKVLPAALLHEEAFSQRFEREARIVAQLEHPHIVPIYNFGIDEGVPWMSMRLLPGGTLAEELKGKRFTPAEVATVLEPVAAALDHAHAHGIVHRDVKPSNVMRDAFGHHYLTDFGIARMSAAATQLTTTGVMTGTPFYMSPEQALAGMVDGRSDIYSLGVVAYEMLTGGVPFTGDTPMAVMMKHTRDPLPVPHPSVLPREVFTALSRCLAKVPTDRFPTATAFVQALRQTGPAEVPTVASRDDGTAQTRAVRMSMSGSAEIEQQTQPAPAPRQRRTWLVAISFTISICALLVVGLMTYRQSAAPATIVAQNEPPSVAPAPATPAPPPAAPRPQPSAATQSAGSARIGGAPPATAPASVEPAPARPAAPDPATPVATSTPPATATPPPSSVSPERGARGGGPHRGMRDGRAPVPPPMKLRFDGSYRTGPAAGGRFMHWIFRADNTCAIVVVPLQALPPRAVPEAPGSSCSYVAMPRRAAIAMTRPNGTTDRAMAVLSPNDSLVIRGQTTEFVPFTSR